jgi:hypothetical protein
MGGARAVGPFDRTIRPDLLRRAGLARGIQRDAVEILEITLLA